MKICKTEKEYLNQIIEPARRCCKRYGYLPSVLIAQSCLENGYGIPNYWDNPQIEALMTYNNMVGIKVDLLSKSWTECGLSVWPGDALRKKTPEVYNGVRVTIDDDFRKYDSIEQSFADILCFFTWGSNFGPGGEPKYGPKVMHEIKDPQKLIKTVKALGYATDPEYPDKVMDIVKKHNLTQYDDLEGVEPTIYYPDVKQGEKMEARKEVEKPVIVDRIAENAHMVPYHNSNSAEYLAIHYLGVNGENPDLYYSGNTKGYGGHFYVSKKGQCFQAAKVSDEIWHVGRGGYEYIHPKARNTNTIGIECATYTDSGRNKDEETWYFTEATQEACAHLAAWILDHYRIPFENMLRHGDITTKNCPSPYKRDAGKGSNWTWERFRARVKEILEGEKKGGYMVTFANVHKGSKGPDAFTCQAMLNAHGATGKDGKPLVLDSDFGDNSDFALREFQRTHGLKVDGDCGKNTWTMLFGKA